MKWLALAMVTQSACTSPCADGLCPRLDQSRHYPGPCESAFEQTAENGQTFGSHCTYGYDGGRITSGECHLWNEYGDSPSHATTTWSYDADGHPVSIESSFRSEGSLIRATRWQLDADPITVFEGTTTPSEETMAFDRATFAFMPIVGSDVLSPRAELGILHDAEETFSWSGNGTTLTRTSSAGRTTTLELDSRGRIVLSRDQQPSREILETWNFDGDLLRETTSLTTNADGTSRRTTRYLYDRGLNIASADGEVYAYDCW